MPTASPHILVIDDEPDIRSLISEILSDEHYQVQAAASAEEAREQIRQQHPDLILLDIWMPGTDGISLLKEWSDQGQLPFQVIMMSGHGSIETAVEATRLGAYDFIEKPLSMSKLLLSVKHAVETIKLKQENLNLKQHQLRPSEPVGRSICMTQLREKARLMAEHDAPILLQGETGTGRLSMGHFLHRHSTRQAMPFITLNAVALDEANLSIELFGQEQPEASKAGLLEQADGGTLFIHELTELPLPLQSRLNSFLEIGQLIRHGGCSPVPFNVRIMASVREPMTSLADNPKLLSALFYRLNVLSLKLPPLREHSEDIPDLVNQFADQLATHGHLRYRSFSTAALNKLRQHPWPGNLSELKNLVQRLLILGQGDAVEAGDIDLIRPVQAHNPDKENATDLPLKAAKKAFEQAYFRRLLAQHHNHIPEVAKHAGLERTNLYRKLRSLDLTVKST